MSNIDYKSDYYHAGVTGMLSENIPQIIGQAEAIDEWVNADAANSNFINIDSYNRFKADESLFLVGRIGTGKTAMLHKLKYELEHSINTNVSIVSLIDTELYIGKLGIAIRQADSKGFSYNEIQSLAKEQWVRTLNILLMQALHEKYGESAPNRFRCMKAFLSEQGLLRSKWKVDELILRVMSNLGQSDPILGGIAATAQGINDMRVVLYDDAVREMEEVLRHYGKALILIDSIERYEFEDPVVLAILNALVNICVDYYRHNKLVSIKMAAPSELIPQLNSINHEKLSSRIVYIRWSYKDLKTFIAVRLYKYCNGIAKEAIVDINDALHFFNNYYDEKCRTRCDILFPTFPYCITYTQKEPRQLISIFNAWLWLEKNKPDVDKMELINDALTVDDRNRIKGALSIYGNIHPRMYDLFQRTFMNRKYCFTEKQFDGWLKSTSAIRDNLDVYELKRYFVSSGLVGIMVELHEIKANNDEISANRNIRIKEVMFEYQYKDYLFYNDETKFCLHPMVFCALNIEVDRNTLVYPRPAEYEDEYIPWLP